MAKAATPITINTISDFKLPPPSRTRVLLPQPDDSTMPKPNINPPTTADNHSKRLDAYSVLLGSIWPVATKAAKPSMATATAKPHWRIRVQSPMFTTSLTAPMVQKWVRWAMAPKMADKIKAAHNTWLYRPLSSDVCMRRF